MDDIENNMPFQTGSTIAGSKLSELDHEHLWPADNQVPPEGLSVANVPFPDFKPRGSAPYLCLPELMRGAVIEMCLNHNFDVSLPMHVICTAASIACQDLIMVDCGFGTPCPVSEFFLNVSDVGGGKTLAVSYILRELEAYDKEVMASNRSKQDAYEREAESLALEIKSLKQAHASLTKKKYHTNTVQAEAALDHLSSIKAELDKLQAKRQELVKPKLRKTLYANTSFQDLQRCLSDNWPAAGMVLSEAGDVLDSLTDAQMACANRIYDGQHLDVTGKTKRESFSVDDPRLTLSLALQPEKFDKFLRRRGDMAVGIGFMPRFLISRSETYYDESDVENSHSLSSIWISRFMQGVLQLLACANVDIADRTSNRQVLRFSPAAQLRWEKDRKEKRAESSEGGRYENLREATNRYSEHVVRISGILHVFTNLKHLPNGYACNAVDILNTDQISEHTVNCAITLCEWFLCEQNRIFNKEAFMPDMANHVLEKLKIRLMNELSIDNLNNVPGNLTLIFEQSKLQPYCTKHGLRRDTALFKRALDWLEDNNKIKIISKNNKSTGRKVIYIELLDFRRRHYNDPEEMLKVLNKIRNQ